VKANTRCRSCRAPVRWCIVEATGKKMPLDPDAVPDGNIWVERVELGTPMVHVALNSEGVPRNVPLRYVSHFVTCPQAKSWRKKS
jgi:hypothetical protein